MSVLGIVAEYNPFHNGHLYHIEESKRLSNADYLVCVMSGNYIQRGEPAIINKWARAKMAIMNGVDLVLELPFVYSVSSAEFFAFGAVKILESIGLVDYICFGSESGSIRDLQIVANMLVDESESFKNNLKSELVKGISFPAAREQALIKFIKDNKINVDLNGSNNILAIEYLKALKRLNSKITPLTIKRMNNSYKSKYITNSISSATSIRNYILTHDNADEIYKVMPENALEILTKEFKDGRGPVFLKDFEQVILSHLRMNSNSYLKDVVYVSEGLENRIKKAALRSRDIEELFKAISTKRYPLTRLQRIVLNSLVGVRQDEFYNLNGLGGPQYIRVLASNTKGNYILSKMKKSALLPVSHNLSKLKRLKDTQINNIIQFEEKSTDLYVLGYKNPEYRIGEQEYKVGFKA